MKNPIKILLLLILVFAAAMSQVSDNKSPNYHPPRISFMDDACLDNNKRINSDVTDYSLLPPPVDTVWYMLTFMDYATNGKSQRQLVVAHDTIIVATTYVDSLGAADPNNSPQMRMRYNYSLDHGVTWGVYLDVTSGSKSRFPDIAMLNINGENTVGVSGRMWNFPATSTIRRAGAASDVVFGAGSFTVNLLNGTLGTDLFSSKRVDRNFACVVQTPSSTTYTTDSIFYTTWRPSPGVFTPLKVINTIALDNTACSYTIAASPVDTNNISVAYCYINEGNFPPESGIYPCIRYQTTTNGGNNWSNPIHINDWGIINGDSSEVYWNLDLKYKPSTNIPYIVFSTNDNTSGVSADASRKAYKICVWSPSLNGGNTVVIADWHNIPILSSAANFQRIRKMHVNSRVLSHPCLSFKNDGSKIYVAYSCAQPDTSSSGFNFEDIYTQFSNDGGLTWSVPLNETNTPNQVEKYPCMDGTFSGWKPDILFQWDLIPGCQNFTDGQQINRVHWVFRKPPLVDPLVNNNSELPDRFSLSQNYPNPFNPSTKIEFDVPAVGDAYMCPLQIIIYDVLGREVTKLVNEQLKPGSYEISWDASNYPSGVYFYKLTSSEFSETRKMVLIK